MRVVTRVCAGHLIEPCTKLAICLRFLAGGQILDLKLIYRVGKSACYACVWLGVDAINAVIPIEFPIHDKSKLKVSALLSLSLLLLP